MLLARMGCECRKEEREERKEEREKPLPLLASTPLSQRCF